ncbi:unnamed protein product [Prunus armeniaca]
MVPVTILERERERADVAWGAGKPLVIEEVNVNPPQEMEIRIKVACTSLCRSDITAWESQGWGLTVTLGVPKVKPEVTAHYGIFLTGRTLKGSLFGGWKPKSDLPSLVDMYTKKFRLVSNSEVEFINHLGEDGDINGLAGLEPWAGCLRSTSA